MKRPADALNHDTDPKWPRQDPINPRTETSGGLNPIGFWAKEGRWPREYLELDMERVFARKKSRLSLGGKRPYATMSMTPSDQKPREEKGAPYQDARYETFLAIKGSFMGESNLGIAQDCSGGAPRFFVPFRYFRINL